MGGVVGAYGSYKNAKAREAADIANARVSNWQAGDALVRGDQAAGEMKLRGGQIEAAGSAAAGHGQVDSQTGSAADVREKTAGMTALDVAKIKNNALRAAFGFKTQAKNYLTDAQAQEDNKSLAILSGVASLATSFGTMSYTAGPGSGVADVNAAYAATPTVAGQSVGTLPSMTNYDRPVEANPFE